MNIVYKFYKIFCILNIIFWIFVLFVKQEFIIGNIFEYLSFTFLLLFLFKYSFYKNNFFLNILVIYHVLFFIPRLIFLLYIPTIIGKLGNDGLSLISINENNVAIVLKYFTFYTLTLICFLKILNILMPLKKINILYINSFKYFKIYNFCIYFSIILDLLLITATSIFDFNMVGEEMKYASLIRLLINPAIIFFILSFFILNRSILSKKQSNLFILFIIIHILSTIILGSRSGIITLILIMIFIFLFFRTHLQFNKNVIFKFLIITFFSSVLTWYAGSYFRQGDFTNSSMSEEGITILRRLGGGAESFALIIVSNNKFDDLKKFHSWTESFIKGLNTLIPGDFYSINKVTAGQYFKEVIYNDYSGKFHGDYWSGYGYLYAIYGFPFSIIVLFIILTITHTFFRFILISRNFIFYLFIIDISNIFCESFLIQGSADSIFVNLLPEIIYYIPFIILP